MVIEKNGDLKKATAIRIRKMEKEFAKEPKLKVFENDEGYYGIVAQVDIPILALCEHHHCSFEGSVHIAYIAGRYLLGLSKLARVAEFFLNPTVRTLQERSTQKIMKYLKDKLQPQGLMVVIKAKHACVAYRGVKKPSWTITSAVDGVFMKDGNARSEFLSLINSHNGN